MSEVKRSRPRQVTVAGWLCLAMALPALGGAVTGVAEIPAVFDEYLGDFNRVVSVARMVVIAVGAVAVGGLYVASGIEILRQREAGLLGPAEITLALLVALTIFPLFAVPLGLAGSGVLWLASVAIGVAVAFLRGRPAVKDWLADG